MRVQDPGRLEGRSPLGTLAEDGDPSSSEFQIIVVVVLYWRRVNNDSGLARVEVSNPPNR